MSRKCNIAKGLLIGFFSGAVVGAATALLYAPKSGRKLRRDLNHKAQDLKGDAGDLLNSAMDKAHDVMIEGKNRVEQIVSDVKHKADDLMKDANRIIKDAKGKASDTIKSL